MEARDCAEMPVAPDAAILASGAYDPVDGGAADRALRLGTSERGTVTYSRGKGAAHLRVKVQDRVSALEPPSEPVRSLPPPLSENPAPP
jgi:hypothetical protein